MRNNVIPQSDYLLFQSNIKVFYMFKIQVQFNGDELSEVWIQCTCCNKFINFHIYDNKQGNFTKNQILPVVIKEEYHFSVDEHSE